MGCMGTLGKRDWHKDNNAEGAFSDELDRFFPAEQIRKELSDSNSGKVGAPFRVPDCAIRWAMMHVASGDGYRTAAKKLSDKMRALGFEGLSAPSLKKRSMTLNPHLGTTDVTDARVMAFGTGAKPRPGAVTVAIDSTGLSPDRPSGWMVYHWNMKSLRGWYKLHATVDVDTGRILSYVVTEPYYSDSLAFDRLIDLILDAGHIVTKVLADAAYDSKENWNRMEDLKIEFVANIRGALDPKKRNASSGKSKGCRSRAKHVKRIMEIGFERWKKEAGYSQRWRVEGTFSDLKRLFGDVVRARKRTYVADMIGWLVRCFNLYKETRCSL